ncbi:MAG: 23S rRNA (guanosine(2251)-2'-O)-methyltransferase RlmB [Bacteroidota bacterium]
MQKKNTLIFGRHPIIDAIESGQAIDKLFLQQGIRGEFEKKLRQLSKQHHIPMQVVPKERLARFTRSNHQGVVGYLSLVEYYKVEDVLPLVYERGEVPLFLLLDGVTDVRNFGAIARSASCCGVQAIIIPTKGSAQINADAIKASAGTLPELTICRVHSLVKTIEDLQLSGIQVLASDLKANKSITAVDMTLPTALILGAEGEGISKAVLNAADQPFIIPQTSTTDSFNVSVAAGIMLYEAIRQRILV